MTFKNAIIVFWGIFLICCVTFYTMHADLFTPKQIALFLQQFKTTILIIYFILCAARGFTLVPSTPFVLAGVLILPQNLFWVLFISMSGIAFSSTLIYYFSSYLGFDIYLDKKYPNQIQKAQLQLNKPTGMFFVFLWSFLPFLPTDIICYVAGTLKVNFGKFILPVLLGELIVCSAYIFWAGIYSI